MRALAWALGLASCILGPALCSRDGTPLSQSHVGETTNLFQPAHQIFEIRQTVLVIADNATVPENDKQRHLTEKEYLLQMIARNNGHWNEHHPRFRLLEALRSFSAYSQTQLAEVDQLKGLYTHVSKRQKALLEREVGYSKKFASVTERIAKNQELCRAIVQHALEFYQIDRAELDRHTKEMATAGRAVDKVSVSQALKHLVRDWAAEGAFERGTAFRCILNTLKSLKIGDKQPLRVVLPGAGLGRLGHEISQLGDGFEVTNNEWSIYQNVVYRFFTANAGRHAHDHTVVYPFVDSWSHHKTTRNMLRGVTFPDDVRLSTTNGVVLVEGDFTTVFGREKTGHFDIVVTYFFIDTARNLMSYFETIHGLLKPGGYWINLGPLLYGSAPFVQLSLEEIVAVTEAMGFSFRDRPDGCCGGALSLPGTGVKICSLDASYSFDERALGRTAYSAQFWVAQRSFDSNK